MADGWMDSFAMQINAPASTQRSPAPVASIATNDLCEAGAQLSVFVTQSDMHSARLSPFPLSLPRPSLQMQKPFNRLGDVTSTMEPDAWLRHIRGAPAGGEPTKRDPVEKGCRRYLVTQSTAPRTKAEKPSVYSARFCHVPLKRHLPLLARDERRGVVKSVWRTARWSLVASHFLQDSFFAILPLVLVRRNGECGFPAGTIQVLIVVSCCRSFTQYTQVESPCMPSSKQGRHWFGTKQVLCLPFFWGGFLEWSDIQRISKSLMTQRRKKKLIAQKQLQRIQTEIFANVKTLKCQKFLTWLSGGRMKERRLPFMYNFKWPSLCGVHCWQEGGLDRRWSEGKFEICLMLRTSQVTHSSRVYQLKEKGGRQCVFYFDPSVDLRHQPPLMAAVVTC